MDNGEKGCASGICARSSFVSYTLMCNNLLKFADDTKVSNTNGVNKLQNDLVNLCKWSHANALQSGQM